VYGAEYVAEAGAEPEGQSAEAEGIYIDRDIESYKMKINRQEPNVSYSIVRRFEV
jgi:hypothetical protein